MKTCSKCSEEKSLDSFSKRSKSADGHSVWCKDCMSNYEKLRYRNGDSERKKANKARSVEKSKQYIWDYLCENPCVDCGESDPLVLEFDHKDNVEKVNEISQMFNSAFSKLKEEISKCDVRCANCHRRRTIKQFGTWRGTMTVK